MNVCFSAISAVLRFYFAKTSFDLKMSQLVCIVLGTINVWNVFNKEKKGGGGGVIEN